MSTRLHLQTFVQTRVDEISLVGPNAIDRPFEVVKKIEQETPVIPKTAQKPKSTGVRKAVSTQDVTMTTAWATKALELHGRDVDSFQSELHAAVVKSGSFGDGASDGWDHFIRSVTDAEVAVQNWNSGDVYLGEFASAKAADGGLTFTFSNVAKAVMRYERISAGMQTAKSLGGEVDDVEWATDNLINAKAADILRSALSAPVDGATDAQSIRAEKAKRLTDARIDLLQAASDNLISLLAEVVAPAAEPDASPAAEADAAVTQKSVTVDDLISLFADPKVLTTLKDKLGLPGLTEDLKGAKSIAQTAQKAIDAIASAQVAIKKSVADLAGESAGPIIPDETTEVPQRKSASVFTGVLGSITR